MTQDPGLVDGIPVDANGTISVVQDPALQAQFSGSTVTALQDFPFFWKGQVLNFFANESAVVTPDLLAALTAAGAPFTTP
jgi:hypothetical protein